MRPGYPPTACATRPAGPLDDGRPRARPPGRPPPDRGSRARRSTGRRGSPRPGRRRRRPGRPGRSPWSGRPAGRAGRRADRLGLAVGDRGEDGQPERAADLGRGVDQPRGEPGLLGRACRPPRRSSPGTKEKPRPTAATATGRGCRGRTTRPAWCTRENQTGPTAIRSMPATRTGLTPILVTRAEAAAGREDDPDGQRQVREPGLERRVVQDALDVEGDEEEHREERHPDHQADDVRPAQGAQAEDREGHQRVGLAPLDDQERGDQGGRAARAWPAWPSSPSRRSRRRRARRRAG